MEELFSIQVFLTAIIYRLLCHRLGEMMMKQPRSHHRRRCIGEGEWPVIHDVTAKIDDNLKICESYVVLPSTALFPPLIYLKWASGHLVS